MSGQMNKRHTHMSFYDSAKTIISDNKKEIETKEMILAASEN